MAQTWRVTRSRVLAFNLIDAIGRRLVRPRSASASPDDVKRILVVEGWLIGDVVLSTPALRALRERFPTARITYLGKTHARDLLEHSGLVDEVIVFDLPWTAAGATKYDPRRYDWKALRALTRDLKARRFDLTLDARMDLRMNAFTRAAGATRRIGFDFGGGTFLLTDKVAAYPDTRHRVDDWLSLMEPLGGASRAYEPQLSVSEDERREAHDHLARLGIDGNRMLIGVHAGASSTRRRFPVENFKRVADTLAQRHSASVLYFLDPGADESSAPAGSASVRTSIRGMMALFSWCDLVLCNDSGPMHIADALDVPVVGVFLTGNPVWHRPYRAWQKTTGAGTGHDFNVAPSEEEMISAGEEQLRRSKKPAQPVRQPR